MEKEGGRISITSSFFPQEWITTFIFFFTGIQSRVFLNSSLKWFRMGAEYLGEHLYVKQRLEMQFNTFGALGRDKHFSLRMFKKGV